MERTEINLYEDRRKRQKTLRLAVIEGTFALVAIGLQQTFYIPFLNAMGATKLQIGVAAGIPALMTGLIQLWVPMLLGSIRSYKKVVMASVFTHAISYLPFSIIAFWHGHNAVWLSIAAVGINASAMGFGAAAWSDWMSYLVPRRRRGIYFSNRNRILTLTQLVISLAAGRFLDTFAGKTMLIFSIIWTVSFISRMIGGWLVGLQYEPPAVRKRVEEEGSFLDFVRQLPKHTFGRFVLGFSLLNFAANVSAPFFTIYMLNDLKLNYLKYTILTSIPSLVIILTMRFWGRLCDRIGYVMPMRFFVTVVLGLPLVWIVTRNYWHLVAVQMFAGMAWGGMNMASFNYTLDAIGSKNRIRSIAYLNVISSFFIFAGSMTGGLLAPILPQITSSSIHSIFLVSVLLRFLPLMLFQTLPDDMPRHAVMSATERFFFDPRLSLRVGFDRTIFGRDKRQI
jgi:MFS family permease